jgi:hypothetical protein
MSLCILVPASSASGAGSSDSRWFRWAGAAGLHTELVRLATSTLFAWAPQVGPLTMRLAQAA